MLILSAVFPVATRMDYARVTARLSYFAEGLGRMFGKPELPPAAEHLSEDGDET